MASFKGAGSSTEFGPYIIFTNSLLLCMQGLYGPHYIEDLT